MRYRNYIISVCLALTTLPLSEVLAQVEQAESDKVVTIGVVGSSNNKTFEKLTKILNQRGYPSKHVQYPTYDAMVDALDSGEIDIAWNSPLSHAKYHIRNQCCSQTLAMRDIDLGLQVTLVAPNAAGIHSLEDLAGKRVIVGRQHYQEGMLSAHFVKTGVADSDSVTIVELKAKDADGNRTDTSAHILRALAEGRGDAAVVPVGFWEGSTEWREKHPDVKSVWKSPEFNHCVFTASKDFDLRRGEQFTQLMTNLDPKDPLVASFNRSERAEKWLPGDSKGFESLIEALQEKEGK